MTQLALVYGDQNYVHQWDLVAGYPQCLLDGLSPSAAGATAALQKSVAVQALLDLVESYEAAQRLVASGQPTAPTTISGVDAQGNATTTPNPVWTTYNAAVALVAGASATTVAHALWRSGEPKDPGASDTAGHAAFVTAHAAWLAAEAAVQTALTSLAAQPLAHDPRPAPTTVPMWAAQAALKVAGKYDAVNAAINAMESSNPPVFFAWTMGNYADRSSSFIGALAAGFGMSSADIDALFVAADKIANAAG